MKVAWTPPLGKLEGYKIYIPRGEFIFLGVCFKRSSELRAGKVPFCPRNTAPQCSWHYSGRRPG